MWGVQNEIGCSLCVQQRLEACGLLKPLWFVGRLSIRELLSSVFTHIALYNMLGWVGGWVVGDVFRGGQHSMVWW